MIEFHDPRGETATPEEKYELSHHIAADGSGTTVGLLANGFPDSDTFLDVIGRVLSERLPKLNVKLWNKGDASITVPEAMLNEIEAECQIAIAAYGH